MRIRANDAKKLNKFKFAALAVDAVVFRVHNDKLQALLMKMKKEPYLKHWACSGGLIRPDESIEQAIKRMLEEKNGLKNIYCEQLYTFGEINRDPFGRVVSTAYLVLLAEQKNLNPPLSPFEKGGLKGDLLQWFNINKLPLLAYDHKEMMKMAIERLRAKITYTNIIQYLLPANFTLSELQDAYEIILGRNLDKRNFRKKIFQLKLVNKLGKKKAGLPNRPADLYSFADKKLKIIEIL